ncbi:MAG: NifB/NifX family molybdenum-iron cluster-binding protein [Nanoarchaeota archaeon]
MKIAISSNENNIEGFIEEKFGRCQYFLIIDLKEDEILNIEAVLNDGKIQGHGAGIRAAEQIGNLNIDFLITGQIGPNALNILNKLNIKIYTASGSIKTAIENLLNNKLKEINSNMDTEEKVEKSNEIIFFPLLNNQGKDSKISEHFGHAPFFGIYDVLADEFKIFENNLDHSNKIKNPIEQIQELVNPTTIFAKGIGSRAIDIINEKGLKLKTGNYSTAREVISNLNNLKEQTQGCSHKH